MAALEADLEVLEAAMHSFFQTTKRPQRWAALIGRAGVNIDRPGALVLHLLKSRQDHQCRLSDIASHLGIEAPSVTRKTQELEAAGYVVRHTDPTDKRAISLRLTPLGQEVSIRIHKAQRETVREAIKGWPASDRRQFAALFERFSRDMALSFPPPDKENL